MTNHLVSIIIPTYNRAQLIGETLDSVLAQTYPNWECIVVDDGSEDYTEELMGFYTVRDSRIQYHHRPKDRPKGANACRNYGFEVSKGEFVQFLDSDDVLSKEKIMGQLEIFRLYPAVELSFCSWFYFKKNPKDYNDYGVFKLLYKCTTAKELFDFLGNRSTFLVHHVYLVKRNLLHRSGLWNEHLTINQDGEFFSRVLCSTNKIMYSKKSEVFYRCDSSEEKVSTYNTDNKLRDAISSWKIIEEYHKIKYRLEPLPYIKNGKWSLFQILLKNKPKEIKANKDFFKNEIKQHSFMFKSIFKVLKLKKYFRDVLKNKSINHL